MKINIVFLLPYNNQGIGGTDRKFGIYYHNLDVKYFNKYCIYITGDPSKVQRYGHEIILLDSQIQSFLEESNIYYIYYGGAKIRKDIYDKMLHNYYIIMNINFTNLYQDNNRILNFIISKTDYFKICLINGKLTNSYVVYNPIYFDNRVHLSQKIHEDHRNYFHDKKCIIGRLGRAEPSKWHFLMISTLLQLQKQGNYSYGFIFAGMPLLYRKALKLLLNKELYKSILFLPELRRLEDISKFYHSIDIFWQTSWIGESFGNVIAEAFCFNVPVITDFKAFYRNSKVNKKLYDAQIELVDNEVNGGYCAYPDSVIYFLENHSLAQLHTMGKAGYQKVQNIYNVKFTSNTMAKILYDFGKKHLSFDYDEKFENLLQIPGLEEVENYKDEYLRRIEECYRFNSISSIKRIIYNFFANIWRSIEYIYLLYRKILKNIFKVDIEK